ncbi:hypothetical protein FG386_002208 [Cryptosporidium ryanae]|uniref:uncharacterized protein n=1 Tax=Cryptosporidium ryanae TaxID=515981 RepID=UPI00351A48BA|nr:hypothetical protein FG386_002208 [Cryptosporidium ryanae]
MIKQILLFTIYVITEISFVRNANGRSESPGFGARTTNDKVPLYNLDYRIRVRKLDPTFRTVVIKGIEPEFPYDINADGLHPGSKNDYSSLPISLHVPIIPIDKTVKLRRIPVITTSPTRLPLEYNERLLSFGVNICNLPSLWYLELSFCMHKGVTKFTTGVLTSYTLQDIIGAALDSMELPSEGFSVSRCTVAVKKFSDVAINENSKEVCNIMASCLSSKEFLSDKKKRIAKKWEKNITNIYKEMPPFFRGQQPRSYAQKIITGIIMARRERIDKTSRKKANINNIPDKLFYIIRCFNFAMMLTEFLINSGFKDMDAFELSPKSYSIICDNALMQPTPVKMIAKCASMVINAHMKYNSIDYFPFVRSATWSPFSNIIIQHACTELVSIGFINSDVTIPKNMSIDEIKYLAFPHLAHSNPVSRPSPVVNPNSDQPPAGNVTSESLSSQNTRKGGHKSEKGKRTTTTTTTTKATRSSTKAPAKESTISNTKKPPTPASPPTSGEPSSVENKSESKNNITEEKSSVEISSSAKISQEVSSPKDPEAEIEKILAGIDLE